MLKGIGMLEAPREDLIHHIGQGEGRFISFVRSCADFILDCSSDRLWRFLYHTPDIRR
jgi:hypothetical protein